jgi:LuxR family transcriptional regulator, maltose regulon positive regulatory protein
MAPHETAKAKPVGGQSVIMPTSQTTPALPLLMTKLYVPPARPNLVSRPRLLERLQAGLRGKLTLISAPAGFGKTTLVSAWLSARTEGQGLRTEGSGDRLSPQSSVLGTRVGWVALDAGDCDPLRFWRYLIAALDMLVPSVGTAAIGLLEAPRPPPIETVLLPLLNALNATPTDMVLVLDDYHVIDTPAIHQSVSFLLDHLPPQLHLIIATRTDPPLLLARLRAHGDLTELRARDLRFTPEEAAVFLTMVMRLPLAADQVAALERRTEGWIAGLQLAALAMRDHGDVTGFISAFTGSNRLVVDYLAEEVINRLPADLQTFLLRTAVLDRMCGALCDAVIADWEPGTGERASDLQFPIPHPQSQMLLEELERANLFIVPLDDTRQWYRYHHLFVDVLRSRLMSTATAEYVATLHRRASTWFEDQGLVAEAVHHALAANDADQAARLVELHGEAVWMHGELATLRRWLTALPDTAFEARPKLALNHAFLLTLLDDFAQSERRLAAAEHALHAAPVPDLALLGQAAVIRTVIALLTDQPAEVTIAAGREALELLPESSAIWRGHASMVLGVGYYAQAGNLELGLQSLAEAQRIGRRAGDPFTAANAAAILSIALEIGGQLRESERLNQHNLQRAAEPFWQGVPLAAYARYGLSRVLYERNDLHTAREYLTEALAQLETWSLKRPMVITCVWLARVHQALGEPEQAREWMARAVAIVEKDDLKQTFSYWAAYRARLALAQGDLSAAAQWAHEIESTTSGDLDPAREFDHITLAQIQLAQQRLDDAQRLLARLLPTARAAGRMGRALEIVLLQTLATQAQGNQIEALATLEQALSLAEPEGYVRIFVDWGTPMAALLRQIARSVSPRRGYAAMLLNAFPEAQSDRSPRAQNVAPFALREPLSERELEILHLIAEGHSNQEIADTLIIAVSTVKKHINNLYGKLGVQSRTQVLVRARTLKLL